MQSPDTLYNLTIAFCSQMDIGLLGTSLSDHILDDITNHYRNRVRNDLMFEYHSYVQKIIVAHDYNVKNNVLAIRATYRIQLNGVNFSVVDEIDSQKIDQ